MSNDHDEEILDLDALAIQERFLEEWRAGQRPRLSAWVRRYPQHAAALAALVVALPPDADPGATQEPLAESFPERLWTGDGIARTLVEAFGPDAAGRVAPRVAEEPTAYHTSAGEPPGDE